MASSQALQTRSPLEEVRRAFFEWARSDGVTWVYVAKVLTAAMLTLWLAMRLELPQPSTATITVFIVMQPQSGQVFAKSFYRILGSLVGLTVMVALIAVFAQERVLFLLVVALWVGACTAGAARYRDFRSYACVLAGYTATLIGLPATLHPEAAFMSAVWRVLEISLGILCSTVVSAVVLPQTSAAAMRNALYQRFGAFAWFVLDNLGGGQRQRFEAANVNFVSQAVGLEALRSATRFEDPHMRLRSGRLARLNNEFMVLTTRYHALHQLLERLRSQGGERVLEALEPCLDELREVLGPWKGKPLLDRDAAALAEQLEMRRQRLMQRIREARAAVREQVEEVGERLDFNTAAELLYRLVADLHNYALTHASLADHHHERENWKFGFSPKANLVGSLVAGARTTLMILVFGLFWIETAWPSGSTFVLNAAAVAALVSAVPDPAKLAMQMAVGTFFAAILGFAETFFVFPHLDGFPLLCVALAPVFALGAFLSVKPAYGGYGLGLLVFFSFGAIPANMTVYDAGRMLNEYIALVLSQSCAALVVAVLLPPTSAWLWRRLEKDLRMRVVEAISGKSAGLEATFESRTRDLMNQAYGVAARRPDVQRGLLRWMFLVLEVGHAIIELRNEQARLPDEPCYAEAMPWRQAIRSMGRALIRLFVQPGEANRERALAAVEHAILTTKATEEPCAPDFESSPLRRVVSYLHFIRTTLLDPQSPLRDASQGTASHAA
ncbi:putative membrane protein YccC [Pseudomonas citronellolis]|uniref:FUSC family protein n=1 Tax=Pseudomonas citronellolis TaxID=53408 RepID=UPI0020A1C49E|nr:FUSC family protein [Pseudomonas citronellolis]MCP1640975.1 putative membrane protein YccC [Pseudomonas citronellolis]MCP1663893.1 putative membrane protein YccC [Pseudomonas citronellolis]MCP1697071.1 putative membrane protein YccC [Pseudomonas citronellolis]MCP1701295.1 putative membrane protein YccC [Pseudomonas citronellolis]MCP1795680.1 putative membrane protein YccC [Pseudomonas citronellolis]